MITILILVGTAMAIAIVGTAIRDRRGGADGGSIWSDGATGGDGGSSGDCGSDGGGGGDGGGGCD